MFAVPQNDMPQIQQEFEVCRSSELRIMATDWTRHLWWSLWLITPIIVWQFQSLTMYLITKANKMDKYKALKEKNQIKVQLKIMRVTCFSTAFIIAVSGLSVIFNYESEHISTDDDLPYYPDKALKLGLILVSTVYLLDIIHNRSYLAWYNWSHHIISMIVFIIIYDYQLSFVVSRLYCCIFGALLTSRWILHFASLYYYLGNENHTEIRICLYLTGLLFHVCFAFGQLIIGLIFKFTTDENIGRLIFWIIFETAVLPSQLHTFYDIYCIIRVKLYHAAFSEKVRRYSVGDPFAIKTSTEDGSPPSNITLAPPMFNTDSTMDGRNPFFDKKASLNMNWNKFLSPNCTNDYMIQPCEGYKYVKTGPCDVVIDTNRHKQATRVSIHGRIRQCAIKNGFFNDDIVAQILLTDAYPKYDTDTEVIAMCNDQKYNVFVTVSNDGIISCALSKNNKDTPDHMCQYDLWYIDLDGISYDYNDTDQERHAITRTTSTDSTPTM